MGRSNCSKKQVSIELRAQELMPGSRLPALELPLKLEEGLTKRGCLGLLPFPKN